MTEAQVYVPGSWECPTCGFVLVRNFMHAQSGNVSVNDNELDEPCPNDGSTMRRQTWQQRAEEAEQRAIEEIDRARRLLTALFGWYGTREMMLHEWEMRCDSDVPMAAQRAKAVYEALRECCGA